MSERPRSISWSLTLCGVLGVAAFSFVNGRSYLEQRATLSGLVSSRRAMVEMLSLMQDVETGSRGFLLTGDERFLEPYDSALRRIQTTLARLSELDAEDPVQRAGAADVARLARQKLDVAGGLVETKRRTPALGSDTVVGLNQGKAIMDATRDQIRTMLVRADGAIAEREHAAATAALRVELALAASLAAAIVVTLAGLWSARRDAERALSANEGLTRDVRAREQAELRLRDQTLLLESVLTNIGDGVLVIDREMRVLMVNPAAQKIANYWVGLQMSAEWSRQVETYLPDGKTRFPPAEGPITLALRHGLATDSVSMMIRTPSGELRSYGLTARPITSGGETTAAVGVFRDMTDMQRAADLLVENELRYRVLSEASFEGVAISRDGIIQDSNLNFSRWLGYEPGELVGVPGITLFPEEERERLRELVTVDEVAYEARMLRRNGTTFPVEVRGRFATVKDERVRIAVVRDVTDKKEREAQLIQKSEQLRALSLRDELTGLHNRRGFMEAAEHQLKSAIRAGESCAIFFADLNGMKTINDELGHEAGDQALRAAGDVLVGVFNASDVIARLGGDEFAVFAGDCDDLGVATAFARIEHAVAELNESTASSYRLSISAGAAVCSPKEPRDLVSLMQAADANMYDAKRARHQRASLRIRAGNT